MRCVNCGNFIPPGQQQCPVCGFFANGGPGGVAQDGYPCYPQNPQYPQYPQNDYQQGVPPSARANGYTREEPPREYATPAFHTYRKQLLHGLSQDMQPPYQTQSRESFNPGGSFAKILSDLPGVVKGAFTSPMDTLLGMVRREDRFTGGLLALLSMIMAFLTAMVMVRGIFGSLFAITSSVTGLQLAGSAASLKQGVAYLAGRVAVPIGGVAAVCQMISIVIPVAVTMIYLSAKRQIKVSFLLLSGFTAITVLPNLIALLLAAVFSMITPYLSIAALLFGVVFSYVMLCTMAVQLANLQPQQAVPVQASLICISELTKILLIVGVGGALMSGITRTLTSLTSSVSGLL